MFRAIDATTNEPVGVPRASIQFARSDALKHQQATGRHAVVLQAEIVWTTQTIEEALKEVADV